MSSAHGSDIILNAKLHRPRVTKDLIVRPRLLALLDTGLEGPLSAVVSPAGFGKTTLVSSWIEELEEGKRAGIIPSPAAWLSLDESDSDLNVFLRYFISALQTVFPGAAPKTLGLLTARQPPLSVLAGILSNEIEGLPSSFIMVLDDAHVLRGQGVFDFLTTWTRHWPRPMHLVLASRQVLPLPLTSLRARGKIIEIRSRDLRFTATETAEYLGRALGSPVEEPAPATIHQQMEGWIAGLKMATLSTDARDSVAVLPREVLDNNVYITGYLIDEVLLRQPAGIQQFLLKTSITPQFCESLCKALLGDQDPGYEARQCLDYLEANELFLTGLDNRREWYRLHQLLRDLLQHKLRRELGEEAVDDLHGRAACWYAEHGLTDQALYHALEGKNEALVTQVIKQGLCDVLNRTDRPRLERWLKILPDEVIARQPDLLIMRVWDHALRWELAQAQRTVGQLEAPLNDTEAATRTEDEAVLRGQIAVFKAQAAYHANQAALAVAYCREALTLIPQEWHYVRGTAITYLGISLHAAGHVAEVEGYLTAEYETTADKSGSQALRLLQALALNALQSNQFETARRTAHAMLEKSNQSDIAVIRGWSYYLLGYVYYQWNNLEAAERHFAAAVDLHYTTQLLVARNGLIGLTAVYQAQVKSAAASATIDDLSRFDFELYGREELSTAAARARLLYRQGDLDGADLWSERVALPPPDQALLPWIDEPLLTRIAILIARNTPAEIQAAHNALDALDEIALRTYNTRSRVEILALRALAQMAGGDVVAARQSLIRSVELARRAGRVRVYVDLGRPMQRLMGQIAGNRAVAGAVRAILIAFEAAGETGAIRTVATSSTGRDGNGSTAPDHLLSERLTARELEVLALMAEPMSLVDISKQLHITHSTVKRHTINVYEKLGVHGRWEAVARAVELGILRSG